MHRFCNFSDKCLGVFVNPSGLRPYLGRCRPIPGRFRKTFGASSTKLRPFSANNREPWFPPHLGRLGRKLGNCSATTAFGLVEHVRATSDQIRQIPAHILGYRLVSSMSLSCTISRRKVHSLHSTKSAPIGQLRRHMLGGFSITPATLLPILGGFGQCLGGFEKRFRPKLDRLRKPCFPPHLGRLRPNLGRRNAATELRAASPIFSWLDEIRYRCRPPPVWGTVPCKPKSTPRERIRTN